ncbi:similar to Saccharomyces cerevisiae YCR035C RRP43 Exosome non-catalytic core component [Maudiozyma barnettii]|uniref:Ribosomal RNA-processing protein 43 n=1 Tax=Maudiozyma barnettii TaxID=61262 RepID=A0A8H2VDF7_9SACH|nr:exosome non-catalytic core subunit RRP43 [Kazachstania barnettii]CAB4253296.1 similar to Saccharomyces cerevisiae YCR035C RRP43 Exosome non-catalytic core component [Kazachstania barnettii]CAD1780168.1 similar to Saccharomyces cerevisiae YCR035C RRP43 Exosome non-catalytic core component [Kazachstania barnettii]
MADIKESTVEVHPVSFPTDILARISPDLSLQRHLSLGFRPSSRGFEEFRDVIINTGDLTHNTQSDDSAVKTPSNDGKQVLGSCVLKQGDVFVITQITGGIIEDITLSTNDMEMEEDTELLEITEEHSDITKYSSVYPVVEINRGRMGACTDEEMTTSQRLYDSLLHSHILTQNALRVEPGVRITNEDDSVNIIYPDSEKNKEITSLLKPKKKWSYVLYAKIEVFGRTGPVYDMCWNSLMAALQSVKLPRTFIDERATDLKMTVRARGRNAVVMETYNLLCDPNESTNLQLRENCISYASSYGAINLDPEADIANLEETDDVDAPMDEELETKTVLLADIDGEAEETCIKSTISITACPNGRFKQFSVVGGGAKITKELLMRSITLSKQRSSDISLKVQKV